MSADVERFRSRPHLLTQVLIAVVVAGLACAFGLLVLGGGLGVGVAIVLPLIVAYGFYRAARVAVETRPDGVRVVNASSSYEVPWPEVARFTIDHDGGRRQVFLERTDGERLPVDVLRGPDVTTGAHRRWADGALAELNRRAEASGR